MSGTPDIVRIQQRTEGDCLRCCVAMLLGVAYEAVPDFVKMAADKSTGWLAELDIWLGGHARTTLVIDGDNFGVGMPKTIPCIAIGPTRRGTRHCVARCNGIVVDPHPDDCGLLSIDSVVVIINEYVMLGEASSRLSASIDRVQQRTTDDALRCCVAMVFGVAYSEAACLEATGEPAVDVERVDAWRKARAGRECNGIWLVQRHTSTVSPGTYFNVPLIEYGVGVATGRTHYVVRTTYGCVDPHPSGLGLRAVDGVFEFLRVENI